jgi:hypothetical protein
MGFLQQPLDWKNVLRSYSLRRGGARVVAILATPRVIPDGVSAEIRDRFQDVTQNLDTVIPAKAGIHNHDVSGRGRAAPRLIL